MVDEARCSCQSQMWLPAKCSLSLCHLSETFGNAASFIFFVVVLFCSIVFPPPLVVVVVVVVVVWMLYFQASHCSLNNRAVKCCLLLCNHILQA